MFPFEHGSTLGAVVPQSSSDQTPEEQDGPRLQLMGRGSSNEQDHKVSRPNGGDWGAFPWGPEAPLPREGDRLARFGSTNRKQDRDGIRLSIVDTGEEETS